MKTYQTMFLFEHSRFFGWAGFRQEIVCSHVESGTGAVRAEGETARTAPDAELLQEYQDWQSLGARLCFDTVISL